MIQKIYGPVIPSTALSTKSSSVLFKFPPGSPSTPVLRHVARKVVRTAVSALCKEMLQPGQCAVLGLHEMEEVEVRLRALARLEPIWGNSEYGDSGSSTQLGPLAIIRDRYASASALEEEIERKLFAGALRDGYVLCQWVSSLTSYPRHVFGDGTLTGFLLPFHVVRLMNKLRPRSIEKIEPREDGIFLSSNMTKFFSSCIANGFPPKDLFSRDDLIRAKTPSLARVANTILALLKWAERPAQTRSHDLHCEEETTKPNVECISPRRLGVQKLVLTTHAPFIFLPEGGYTCLIPTRRVISLMSR